MAGPEADAVMDALYLKCEGMFCKGNDKPALPEHTCPYVEDIENDDSTLCRCCEHCQDGCSDEC